MSPNSLITQSRLEEMEAHLDAGGKFSHANAVDLFRHIHQHQAELMARLQKEILEIEDGPPNGSMKPHTTFNAGIRKAIAIVRGGE